MSRSYRPFHFKFSKMLNIVVNIRCIGACSAGPNNELCIFLFIKNRVVTRAPNVNIKIFIWILTFGFGGWRFFFPFYFWKIILKRKEDKMKRWATYGNELVLYCHLLSALHILFKQLNNSTNKQSGTHRTKLGAEGKNFHPSGWQFTEEFSGFWLSHATLTWKDKVPILSFLSRVKANETLFSSFFLCVSP
jgi:hypothetical protein